MSLVCQYKIFIFTFSIIISVFIRKNYTSMNKQKNIFLFSYEKYSSLGYY